MWKLNIFIVLKSRNVLFLKETTQFQCEVDVRRPIQVTRRTGHFCRLSGPQCEVLRLVSWIGRSLLRSFEKGAGYSGPHHPPAQLSASEACHAGVSRWERGTSPVEPTHCELQVNAAWLYHVKWGSKKPYRCIDHSGSHEYSVSFDGTWHIFYNRKLLTLLLILILFYYGLSMHCVTTIELRLCQCHGWFL